VFKDEIKKKLDIKSEVLPFALSMLSRSKLIISGVKGVINSSAGQMRFRLNSGTLSVLGEDLEIVEIGGSDVYVKGKIGGLSFE